MPWKVAKEGNKYRVVRADTGDIAKNASGSALDGGGHSSPAKALAQVRALYASEDTMKKHKKE